MSLMQRIAAPLQPLLKAHLIRQTRRNHGLEHATVHLLNRQGYQLSGRSSVGGFVLIGNIPTHKVHDAAHRALERMRQGEHQLAIHPNCGTNLITGGLLSALVALLGFAGVSRRRAVDRFPLVMLGMMLVSLYNLPIGMSLQRHITTEGDPGELEIVGVVRRELPLPWRNRQLVLHHVVTRRG